MMLSLPYPRNIAAPLSTACIKSARDLFRFLAEKKSERRAGRRSDWGGSGFGEHAVDDAHHAVGVLGDV